MWRRTGQAALAAALWAGLAVGCDRGNLRPSYPPDPLLISRKPIESRPDNHEPVLLARQEPDAPDPPPAALASAPADLGAGGRVRLASRSPRAPVPVAPAIRSSPSSGVPAHPAIRRRVAGTFGHASDYSWLQGIPERDSEGRLRLRYLAPGDTDPLGGHVYPENDSRLERFRDGEIIHVTGEVVRAHDRTLPGPRYRIRDVRPVSPVG